MSNTYPYLTIVLLARRVSDFAYPAKWGATVRNEVAATVRAGVRVDRPGIVSAFMPTANGRSKFARLSPITRAETHDLARVIERGTKDEWKAWANKLANSAIVVGTDDLGRCKRDPDKSTGQSILLWAKQNLAPVGLCDDRDVTPLVVPVKLAKDAGLI
jgi:hypothetical protein